MSVVKSAPTLLVVIPSPGIAKLVSATPKEEFPTKEQAQGKFLAQLVASKQQIKVIYQSVHKMMFLKVIQPFTMFVKINYNY